MKKTFIGVLIGILFLFGACAGPAKPVSSAPESKPALSSSSQATSFETSVSSQVDPQSSGNKMATNGAKLVGKFSPDAAPGEFSATLELKSDGSFELVVNLLEGMGTITGKYTVDGDKLALNVEEKDFSGFVNEDTNPFEFTIVDDDTLQWNSPYLGDAIEGTLFKRYG